MRRGRVLVVSGDRDYRDIVSRTLARRGHRSVPAAKGMTALAHLARARVDLTVLDPQLPDMDGDELCRRLRDEARVPFIIVSGVADERSLVRGLELGADDYVIRPFAIGELIARIEAVLRRCRPWGQIVTPAPLADGELTIDFAAGRACLDGSPVPLSEREFGLLYCLALTPGRPLASRALLERVWGAAAGDQTPRLQAAIGRLRRKIERDPRRPRHLLTQPGVGYMLAAPS